MSITTKQPSVFQQRAHFKECCIYQVYPASFCDSNGDGIGDIQGMISKLDYLKDLGVDVVWLSPVYQSPFIDNGYDISDYQDIHPQFGTLADVDQLIAEMHARDMKLVMDLVVNHTSDQHKWFIESRKSKDNNPYREFYIWRPAKWSSSGERLPPNNWREEFSSGSAWEWDEGSQEYFLHLYCKEQPDLNWESPAVRKAVYTDIMKWWLDRGCDGFRMDVINLISKVPGLPDATVRDANEKFQWPYEHCANGLQMIFQNHDVARSVSRFGNDSTPEHRSASAKLLAIMECTLTGSLYVYQGEEIAMANLPVEWPIEEYKDIASQTYYYENPMQWDNSSHGGFTSGKPWMRVHDDYPDWNVAKQIYGIFTHLTPDDERVYAYTKEYESELLLVVLNFTDKEVGYALPNDLVSKSIEASIGNGMSEILKLESLVALRPYEGFAVVLT
ncbi:hypothetical protein IAR55_005576 [Kwoniella newhampshirensis]|uniref:Glycosyl hydrolase family 13 catalytic domain-containing protein n=1 Tax=Kwoniella newhampshirensis TaxID=1651941 RepID=A0AAW0YVU0_9TREE